MTEPSCHFCGVSDKGRCKTQEDANLCSRYQDKKPLEFFDFGFTFGDNEEDKAEELRQLQDDVLTTNKELEELRRVNKRLDKAVQSVYNAIIPFLDNLCANPEKPTIHWPNRVEKIQEFKTKLAKLAQGK